MNLNTEQNILAVKHAILKDQKEAEITGFQVVNLPSGQKTGTNYQRKKYADVTARKILNAINRHNIKPLPIMVHGEKSENYAFDFQDVAKYIYSPL